ncbi:MAG: hypothetical protein HYV67_03265 [Candidatus Taylorbacteria bacterium]|nr:hypothetical protein [Candidatus Taylorbacteria bacterium]
MKAVLIKKGDIEKTLSAKPVAGKNMLEPFRSFALENKLPLSILEDTTVSNDAEVHMREGDLWLCLEGEAEFVCGGALKTARRRLLPTGAENPNELFGPAISGGQTFTLHAGDWLWIPAGEPHQHSAHGTARLVIIKISTQEG